jgi:hypothetical protein
VTASRLLLAKELATVGLTYDEYVWNLVERDRLVSR